MGKIATALAVLALVLAGIVGGGATETTAGAPGLGQVRSPQGDTLWCC